MTKNPNPLRAGLVGAGPGSFIGAAHRAGLVLDGRYRIVAGCFSRDPDRSRAIAAGLGIEPDRGYPDFLTMARTEAARADGIDLAVVATPNDTHVAAAAAFVEAGIAVACEKPLATDSGSAELLVRTARERGVLLAVAHCYSAYPMVRHAARLIRDGDLGEVRHVEVEAASGWAATPVEAAGGGAASWRMDPPPWAGRPRCWRTSAPTPSTWSAT